MGDRHEGNLPPVDTEMLSSFSSSFSGNLKLIFLGGCCIVFVVVTCAAETKIHEIAEEATNPNVCIIDYPRTMSCFITLTKENFKNCIC